MNLPTVEVTDTEYATVMSAFDTESAYQTWLLSAIRSEAVRRKAAILHDQANTSVRSELEAFSAGLPAGE